ncbi:MAG: Dabb family protein [Thermoguttaceae bacterium]|jgi:hypothetical protein
MKRIVLGLSAVVACLAEVSSIWAASPEGNPNLGKVRHIVLFQFKEGTTPEQVKAIENAFRALPQKIPLVAGFEWGTNMSPENRAQGFTHGFLLTFKTPADRDAYLPHPAHKAFGKLLGPHLEKVLVFDFVAKE